MAFQHPHSSPRRPGDNPDYLPSLQILRGVAAFLVVGYHIESRFPESLWSTVYDVLFSRGHMGVDIFFVLSGFLMTYLRPAKTGFGVAGRFMFRRLVRIWPSYALVTLLIAGTVFYESARQIMLSLMFLPQAAEPPLVLGFPTLFVGWTLNYEAFFYLLCSVSLLFISNRYFLRALLAWSIVTLVVIPLACGQNLLTAPLHTPAEKYPSLYLALMTNPIIWEFVMGAATAVLISSKKHWIDSLKPATARWIGVFSLAFFALSYLALDNKMEPLACGLPSAVLVAGLVIADLRQAWRAPGFLGSMGDASYCIYLLHPLWIAYLTPFLEYSAGIEKIATAAVFVLTLLSAILMHHCFERPLAWGARRICAPRQVSPQYTL